MWLQLTKWYGTCLIFSVEDYRRIHLYTSIIVHGYKLFILITHDHFVILSAGLGLNAMLYMAIFLHNNKMNIYHLATNTLMLLLNIFHIEHCSHISECNSKPLIAFLNVSNVFNAVWCIMLTDKRHHISYCN